MPPHRKTKRVRRRKPRISMQQQPQELARQVNAKAETETATAPALAAATTDEEEDEQQLHNTPHHLSTAAAAPQELPPLPPSPPRLLSPPPVPPLQSIPPRRSSLAGCPIYRKFDVPPIPEEEGEDESEQFFRQVTPQRSGDSSGLISGYTVPGRINLESLDGSWRSSLDCVAKVTGGPAPSTAAPWFQNAAVCVPLTGPPRDDEAILRTFSLTRQTHQTSDNSNGNGNNDNTTSSSSKLFEPLSASSRPSAAQRNLSVTSLPHMSLVPADPAPFTDWYDEPPEDPGLKKKDPEIHRVDTPEGLPSTPPIELRHLTPRDQQQQQPPPEKDFLPYWAAGQDQSSTSSERHFTDDREDALAAYPFIQDDEEEEAEPTAGGDARLDDHARLGELAGDAANLPPDSAEDADDSANNAGHLEKACQSEPTEILNAPPSVSEEPPPKVSLEEPSTADSQVGSSVEETKEEKVPSVGLPTALCENCRQMQSTWATTTPHMLRAPAVPLDLLTPAVTRHASGSLVNRFAGSAAPFEKHSSYVTTTVTTLPSPVATTGASYGGFSPVKPYYLRPVHDTVLGSNYVSAASATRLVSLSETNGYSLRAWNGNPLKPKNLAGGSVAIPPLQLPVMLSSTSTLLPATTRSYGGTTLLTARAAPDIATTRRVVVSPSSSARTYHYAAMPPHYYTHRAAAAHQPFYLR